MDYSEFSCDLQNLTSETKELLTALLAEIGFESFYEENDCFKAYIPSELLDEQALQETLADAEPFLGEIFGTITKIPSQNWNAEWESSFQCIEISKDILIRIPDYKPSTPYRHEIIIQPEMSFGTGTHETTSLILETMLSFDFNGKSVVDCGCGTGVLGIFAAQLGASQVYAFDNDMGCVRNTNHNMQLNCVKNITVENATLEILQGKQFNYTIANINKNILIANMQYIAQATTPQGIVMLSGFYSEDVDDICETATKLGLRLTANTAKNNWTLLTFIKE